MGDGEGESDFFKSDLKTSRKSIIPPKEEEKSAEKHGMLGSGREDGGIQTFFKTHFFRESVWGALWEFSLVRDGHPGCRERIQVRVVFSYAHLGGCRRAGSCHSEEREVKYAPNSPRLMVLNIKYI